MVLRHMLYQVAYGATALATVRAVLTSGTGIKVATMSAQLGALCHAIGRYQRIPPCPVLT